MQSTGASQAAITTRMWMPRGSKEHFALWQSRLHTAISSFDGFLSLEITAPDADDPEQWVVAQCFESSETLAKWVESSDRKHLFEEVGHIIEEKSRSKGVTEVFVTKVKATDMGAYRQWIGKIHEAEAQFPGFQRVYVQSPNTPSDDTWITFLQFDTVAHLEHWLQSPERRKILDEAGPLMQSLESHRMFSPFAAWFSKLPSPPAVWKQTMLILLVLYPIVMLEMLFLNPLLTGLYPAMGTFIGNAISVTLVSWPMMPLAIYFVKWWLAPSISWGRNVIGILFIVSLYLFEIFLFFHIQK